MLAKQNKKRKNYEALSTSFVSLRNQFDVQRLNPNYVGMTRANIKSKYAWQGLYIS